MVIMRIDWNALLPSLVHGGTIYLGSFMPVGRYSLAQRPTVFDSSEYVLGVAYTAMWPSSAQYGCSARASAPFLATTRFGCGIQTAMSPSTRCHPLQRSVEVQPERPLCATARLIWALHKPRCDPLHDVALYAMWPSTRCDPLQRSVTVQPDRPFCPTTRVGSWDVMEWLPSGGWCWQYRGRAVTGIRPFVRCSCAACTWMWRSYHTYELSQLIGLSWFCMCVTMLGHRLFALSVWSDDLFCGIFNSDMGVICKQSVLLGVVV